jgi:preprotein translocase subunit SecA
MSKARLLSSGALAAGRPYAERSEEEPGWHDRAAEFLLRTAVSPLRRQLHNPALELGRIVELAGQHDRTLRRASDAELLALTRELRVQLRQRGFLPDHVGRGFALVREAAARTLGLRHFDVQLMGGWALLQGKLIEMDTGEGKTLVATLPASVVALAGYPVHVITVNDYLAGRDAEEMGPLYRFLGLEVGAVVHGMTRPERRQAYARAVTYCSNKELAFDYLRDRVALAGKGGPLHLSLERLSGRAGRGEDLVLRGLCFGLVDEADSVLVDEARTPLILSASVGGADDKEQCERALEVARQLVANEDYAVDRADRHVRLTAAGAAAVGRLAADLDGVWTSTRGREELVTQALSALLLYARDQHYVISDDGKVQIVDESTGRVMADRSWERGLHQLIEVKEGCEPTERRETLARLTYQRLFRRYLRLSGMTGTAREVAGEVQRVYGLDVVRIPLHRPSQRRHAPPRLHVTRQAKWRAIADDVERIAAGQGRPVLIGTRSVKASEEISALLGERGIEHALLNAKQDRQEAEVVARAGQPGRVTVATNMAGRGTDIRLGDRVVERGGLHVILSEYHETARVDRQFYGRCARQGDPGSCQAITSLEDELFVVHGGAITRLVRHAAEGGARLPSALLAALRRLSQFAAERRNAYVRVQNLQLDRRLDRVLAFSGRGE